MARMFLEMNRQGQFLLILDGFDEMRHAMDLDDFVYTFEQMKPLFAGKAKVIILGRPDSFLSTHEEVAVLSACETAAGRDLPGEGMEALSRSFLLAGASTVIASLWRVSDTFYATGDLMNRFHSALHGGQRPSEALAAGQRAALRSPAMAHPYFWAAFQATGADEALVPHGQGH